MSRFQTLLAVFLCVVVEGATRASDFVIDPTQSYLMLTGTAPSIHGYEPIEAQSAGSLTDHLTGDLLVNLQTPGQLEIVGSSINGIPHAGEFQPDGLPADFAGQAPDIYQTGGTGYISVRNSFDYVTSTPLSVDGSGTFNASGVQMRVESNEADVVAAPFTPFRAGLDLEMSNLTMAPGSLTTVGDQYRLVIPFQGTATAYVGENIQLNVSGQLVAMRPIAGSTAPDIRDGGFENHYVGPGGPTASGPTAWQQVIPGTSNNVTGCPVYPFNGQRPMAAEGLQTAFINVYDGTASLYQTIIPGGQLQPNTVYEVTFDVGNRDLTDNGNLPNNAMDPFISVKGFFTLGNDLVDFSKHVGDAYNLAQLSSIPDGTWTYSNTVLLDTSLLTPEQLAEPLNFVLQATSTTTLDRGQVNFDDVRLFVVPEPVSGLLAIAGFGGWLAICRRWKRATAGPERTLPRSQSAPTPNTFRPRLRASVSSSTTRTSPSSHEASRSNTSNPTCSSDHCAWANRQ